MKLKVLLVLLLIVAVLLPLTSIFQSASVSQFGYSGIGSSVVVVAKESNVYARVEITVQPFVNNTNVVVQGGSIQPTTLTFPNGTTVAVTRATTFDIVLPNSVIFNFGSPSAGGFGYSVSPSRSISLEVLNGLNATYGPASSGAPGIDIFQYTVTGDYELSVQALGVSI
jgi:hypothetical protein